MAGPTYPAEDGPRRSAIPHAGVAATLLVFLGCTQTSVEPVAVASIAISPERFTTLVSDEMPLSLEIRDLDGNPLSRPDVVWSSLNPAVATVTSEGVVQAVSPGQVLITAKVEGAVGTAQATIEARPETRLSPGSLDLSGTAGSGAIQAAIRVTNQGGGTLDDLSVRVAEGGDWIDATLAGGKAPTDLNLSVRPNSLSPGTYRGRVEVRSDHGSRTATINLQVRPKAQDPDEKDDSGSDDSGNSDDEEPAKPSKLEAEEDGQSRIDLAWEDKSDNERSFEIQRRRPGGSWATIATIGPDRESYEDRGLEEGTTYEYRIRACNNAGCSDYSSKANATTDDSDDEEPKKPSKLEAEEDGQSRIDLEWEDKSDNERSFEIQRRRPGGSWATIATIGPDRESYEDRGLEEDTTYEYRIRACNNAGCSDYSNKSKATTDDD